MGLKGYRLWVMGQLDSTYRAPPHQLVPLRQQRGAQLRRRKGGVVRRRDVAAHTVFFTL
jgi:hypothetical protein